MSTKRKGKTVPCEGCRERKKKCTAGQPCERCKRLRIQCYYLKPVAPPKLESIEAVNNQVIQHHVEVLEDIMRTMERELHLLKSPWLLKNSPQTNSSKISAEFSPEFDNGYHLQKSLVRSNTTNWQFKIAQGGVSINTDIQSYSELLKHIEALRNTPTFIPIVKQPTLASLSAGGGYLHRHVLSSFLRKGQFKATITCIQNLQQKRLMIEPAKPAILEQQKNLSLKLVDAYFACRFFDRVIFHQKTFADMFIKTRTDPESSPVVCALSAAVLTMHCKHVLAIVPFNQQLNLGEYYFNKARVAVSLQFDEPSMETMIAYLHMSLYKANLLRPRDADVYLEMAIRIRQILAEGIYKEPPAPKSRLMGEYETFKRLHAGFQDSVQFIQFVNNKRGVPVQQKPKPPIYSKENTSFQRLFCSICEGIYDPTPMPDESRQTVRAVMKEHYIGGISRAVGPYFRRVRFGQDDMVPLSFLLKTEEDLNQVYYQQIPPDYQLSPSIFEDGIDHQEFKKRLQEDERCDVVSVTIAARYYQSLLAIHEPFLPVIRRPPTLLDLSLLQDLESLEIKKKRKRKDYDSFSSSYTLSSSTSSDTDDDTILSVHVLRAQNLCYKCAIIVVRLLEYQCTALEACTIPTPSLLCAWDILMRNSCLGMTQEDLDEAGVSNYLTANDIRISREYAVRCIEVLRRGYMFNGAEREIWEYYERIERQLLMALCTAAPATAKYWEPVDTW